MDLIILKNITEKIYRKHKIIFLDLFHLTEAGAYPQLPTQPNFFDRFQTYTAI